MTNIDLGAIQSKYSSTHIHFSGSSFPLEATDRYIIYKGNSMHPLLHDSELLILEPYENKLPKDGDVIAFNCPSLGYKVIHRIISVHKGTIRTQGDSNKELDPYLIYSSAIIGRIVGVCRNGRTVRISGGIYGVILGWCLRRRNNLARWRGKFL